MAKKTSLNRQSTRPAYFPGHAKSSGPAPLAGNDTRRCGRSEDFVAPNPSRTDTPLDGYGIASVRGMLHWSLIFLVIALIAGLLGFTGIAGAAMGIAKILFFVFLIIWLVVFFVIRRTI
jgi:uncharacterized membrane protein YtjA (UPF0391 family)